MDNEVKEHDTDSGNEEQDIKNQETFYKCKSYRFGNYSQFLEQNEPKSNEKSVKLPDLPDFQKLTKSRTWEQEVLEDKDGGEMKATVKMEPN